MTAMKSTPGGGIFRVTGGTPLRGEIKPQGNKNEALPVLAACCLTGEVVELENLPAIEDVGAMIHIIEALGGQVETGPLPGRARVRVPGDLKYELPAELSGRLRGSVTLAGPMLARCGRVFLPMPGGDKIGRRRIDTHLQVFQSLGAEVEATTSGYDVRVKKLRGADILLEEASVTATENAVCLAAAVPGETILRNAAGEPHVQNLCRMLVRMGAAIEGIGSNLLRIQGTDRLRGCAHTIGPDYQEIGSFIALAVVTKGSLLIREAGVDDLRMIRAAFGRLGVHTEVRNANDLFIPDNQDLRIINDWGGAVPKIDDAPWPGFPADLTSVALVTATQCQGTILIHEKMYESRLYFTDSLISMGARIILCDPHRAVVIGPDRLRGARLNSPDIRAGMAMLIAALCAEGDSVIQNIVQIDRGFACIEQRLQALGAQLQRVG